MGLKKFITNVSILSFALVSLATFSGCGSDSTGNDSSPLLSVETLQRWIAAGYKDDDGKSVVILDWSFGTGYADGHVPGAKNLGSTASMNRSNGVATVRGMVWDGATMDAALTTHGIGNDTTLVFTSSSRMMASTRNWWTFRYWGFSPSRLKVLNGLASKVWPADNLETGRASARSGPSVAGATASVSSNNVDRSVLATLDDVIAVADGGAGKVLDVRGASEYDGTNQRGNAFGGHIKGAVFIPWQDFVSDDGSEIYKSADEIKAVLAAGGISTSDTVHTHCETAVRSGVSAFAMIALLEMSATNYDGAWTEWGNMASAANGGTLPDDSPWRTDNARTESMVVNADGPSNAFTLNNAYAGTADAIPLQDMAY